MEAKRAISSIRVDCRKVLGTIDRGIYGHFIEHLGGCVYGGIWAEEGFPGPTRGGIREDVLELVRALRPSCIRWPGGCFTENYHWRDGVGERRPVKFDWFWNKPEPNRVGTHEFLQFCGEVGAETVICANFHSATPEEAAAWVQYCNGDASTPEGRRRAENGHPEPFNVLHWDIGNETWSLGKERYAKGFVEFHREMKAADERIKCVAVGPSHFDRAWNEEVLQVAGEYLDYLAPHCYTGWGERDAAKCPDWYYRNLSSALEVEDVLRKNVQMLDEFLPHRSEVGIALDEWGVWTQTVQGIHQNYDLSDGLVAASVFNAMHRLCRRVKMANWAQLVNVLGVIQANATQAFPTPVYHVFRLYSNLCEEQLLESEVVGEAFDVPEDARFPAQGVPCLDVSATRSADGKRFCLMVVNRHRDEAIEASLELKGARLVENLRIFEMNGPEPGSMNTFAEPEAVHVSEKAPEALPERYAFPPHSLTAFAGELR